MALTLADIIRAVRDRSPLFVREWVPDAALARYLTGYQRELVAVALQYDRNYLAQQMSVVFDIAAENAVGTAGAGTTGGLPADVTDGSVSVVQSPVGTGAEIDTGPDASVFVAESVVTAATATTLSDAAKSWTVDEHATRTVVIRTGTGQGQVRTIASNTATQLTVSQAWAVTPDTTSTYEVVVPEIEATQTLGVVAASPFTVQRTGYLVRTSAQGVPYLDVANPVVASYDVGIELPPTYHLIGGTVRFEGQAGEEPLAMVDYKRRLYPGSLYAAYVQGQTLYLCGDGDDWRGAVSLDLRFVPVPPALTRLTDYFLVPDTAYQALVDAGAWHAAIRVGGLPGVPKVDAGVFREAKQVSEEVWGRAVSAQKRTAKSFIKPWGAQ